MSIRLHLLLVVLSAIFCLIAPLYLPAQGLNLGIPPVRNFPKKAYRAGTQNWDAAQDAHGVMYFANNNGLLRFDGSYWSCLPVDNHTIVRSVAISPDGRVFVGAQSELGYFSPGSDGRLHYHSLVDLLPESQRSFEDVWDIVFWNGDVFFRTNRVVFQYKGQQLLTHEPCGALTALFSDGRQMILQCGVADLLIFRNERFEPFAALPDLGSAVTGALPWSGDTLLLSSLKNGLFYLVNGQSGPWETPHDALLREKRIYTAAALPNGQLALGTSLDGLIVLDTQRRMFRHLTNKNGLQNNNILHVYCDRSGNAWLGLDNGIDYVVLTSPFNSVIPDGDLQGTGYAAAVYRGMLYLGVSNGVYAAPWKDFYDTETEPFFQRVKASDGQVWSLNERGGQLLMGHHEGAFRLDNATASRISALPGAWTFVQLNDDYLLGGTYNGLLLYRKTPAGAWAFDEALRGLQESCRIMVRDADGAVWVSHPYRGLYRVEWQAERKSDISVRFYNAANGLPSDLNNYVFTLSGKAVFATEKGLYRFDKASDRFMPDRDFNNMLGIAGRLQYLREDALGNIWFVAEQEVGMLRVNDLGVKKEVSKQVFPELNGKLVGGFEFMYPIDRDNILFGTEQGFIHYHPATSLAADTLVEVVFRYINASNGPRDSILLEDGQPAPSAEGPVLTAVWNNLRFAYAATDYAHPDLLQYRVQLVGYDSDWSEWSAETARAYTNLGAGAYTFKVQARRKNGPASPILAYSFKIRPPWYSSIAARLCYAFLFIGLMAWLMYRQRKKLESEKAQLTVKHQQKEAQHLREVERSQAALVEIQNEKLADEIKFKNQELASLTMHLVQKGEILLTVQEALNHILEKSTHPSVKKEVQQLLNLLNFDAKLDEDWEQFAFRFDQVHVDFLKHLREKFPQLSTSDHKLCAFLRMNLSTKEIAPLLNISVRGVEASRYRLRKKLNLPNDVNLTDFMMSI